MRKSDNPFALVILTALMGLQKGLKDEELFALKYDLVKRLMKIKLSREKIQWLLGFIRSYLNFEDKEMNIKFAKRIEPITTKNTSMGILEIIANEAKKEGIKEKAETIVKNLLKEGLDIRLIRKTTLLPLSRIKELQKSYSKPG